MKRMRWIAVSLLIGVGASGRCFAGYKPFACKDLLSGSDFQKIMQKSPGDFKLFESKTDVGDPGDNGKMLACSYVRPTALMQTPEAGDVIINVSWLPGNPVGFEKNHQTSKKLSASMSQDVPGLGTFAYERKRRGGHVDVFSSNKKYAFYVTVNAPHSDRLPDAERAKRARAIAQIINENLNKY